MPFFTSLSFDGQKKFYQKGWPMFEPWTLGMWSQCATILPQQLLIKKSKKLKLWRAWAVKTKGTKKWHLQTLIQRDLKKKCFCPYNVFVYIFLSIFLMLNGYSFPKTILTEVIWIIWLTLQHTNIFIHTHHQMWYRLIVPYFEEVHFTILFFYG